MKNFNNIVKELRGLRCFTVLWITQSLSALGSAMTNFALIIWLYGENGSAAETAMLSVCSYAPYVAVSIFAGALIDKWNKKAVMLVCDAFAALCTAAVLVLLTTDRLRPYHLYVLNTLNSLMNTIQQPASEVAVTALVPKKHFQRIGAMKAFSNSLIGIFAPVLSSAILAFWHMSAVIAFDLASCFVAEAALLFFVKIPRTDSSKSSQSILRLAKDGIIYLRQNKGIFRLILFLAAINLIASMYNSALPAMCLSRNGGSQTALGAINTAAGLAMLCGSIIAVFMPKPKSRVKVILNTLLLSMSTENYILALGGNVYIWCMGAVLGWLFIPIMNSNMDSLLREFIPVDMQGRVYSARNTFQFFTIPVGYMLGGLLVDNVFEPFMCNRTGLLQTLFGSGKGSGAALLFMLMGFAGTLICLLFRHDRYIYQPENKTD